MAFIESVTGVMFSINSYTVQYVKITLNIVKLYKTYNDIGFYSVTLSSSDLITSTFYQIKSHLCCFSLIHRVVAPERRRSLTQFGQTEAGWRQRLHFRQEAEVQRSAERSQLQIQGHCSEEGRRLHTRPAVQPDIRQQCTNTRGKSLSVRLLYDGQETLVCYTDIMNTLLTSWTLDWLTLITKWHI